MSRLSSTQQSVAPSSSKIDVLVAGPDRRSLFARHAAIIQSLGYTSLDEVGNLTLPSAGGRPGASRVFVQTPGVVLPLRVAQWDEQASLATAGRGKGGTSATAKIVGPNRQAQSILVSDERLPVVSPQELARGPVVIAGKAVVAPTAPASGRDVARVSSATGSVLPIDTAIWLGNEINVPSNTTIVLAPNVKNLVILARKVTFGANVSFGWERGVLGTRIVPTKPVLRTVNGTSYPEQNQDGEGFEGYPGTPGLPGFGGDTGHDAPMVELWALDVVGAPTFELSGQDGGYGGRGGDGGDGAEGGRGRNADTSGGRKWNASPGGRGGKGGTAGNGGVGGTGGKGGSLSLFLPQDVLNRVGAAGYTCLVNGGAGGPGGVPGLPGNGGPGGGGGEDGRIKKAPHGNEIQGASGSQGDQGTAGALGPPGDARPQALRQIAIVPDDFNLQLSKPRVQSWTPQFAFVGDKITVTGANFTMSDRVFVEGTVEQGPMVQAATTVNSDQMLQFDVPNVPGGFASFEVRQPDGTISVNRGSLYIRPKIDVTQLPARIMPGDQITIKGTGFGRWLSVRLNDEDALVPSTAQQPNPVLVDGSTVKVRLKRPSNIIRNAAGEPAKMKIVNSETFVPTSDSPNLADSAQVDVILETYRIAVVGDSTSWQPGNEEKDKHYIRIGEEMQRRHAGIGVYTDDRLGHTGAKIGLGDTTQMSALPQELSSRYPTIEQQVSQLIARPGSSEMDLVLVHGGANDVGIVGFLLRNNSTELELSVLTEAYCHQHMKQLITRIGQAMPKAKIVVCGYNTSPNPRLLFMKKA